MDPTLLAATCCMRPFAWYAGFCWDLLDTFACSLKLVKLSVHKVPIFFLFCDGRSVNPTCCARLHGTHNIVGTFASVCMGIKKTDAWGFFPRMRRYSSRSAAMLGVVAFTCTHKVTIANNSQYIGPTVLGLVASISMGFITLD